MNKKDEWGTPRSLFDVLDAEFSFTLDPCANYNRALKNMAHINKYVDGLGCAWFGRVFVNPPYSGKSIEQWIRKADVEAPHCEVIVMLIPTTKTGTKWFKELVLDKDVEMRFLTGRINFVPLAGQNDNSNPLYSMLLIWRNEHFPAPQYYRKKKKERTRRLR